MNAFEFNKIAGAVLAALLAVFGTRTLIGELRHDRPPKNPGYVVEIASTDAGASTGGDAAEEVDIAALMASADVAAGQKLFKKCKACHTVDAGGPNRVGPNLHGVADKDIASSDGFAYSAVLQGLEGNWTIEALDGFLKNPKAFAKGTKMGFRRHQEAGTNGPT